MSMHLISLPSGGARFTRGKKSMDDLNLDCGDAVLDAPSKRSDGQEGQYNKKNYSFLGLWS